MIIVTGATGQLGRVIIEKLVERVPAGQVGASVRDLEKAGSLTALGVTVRQADFDNPQSLRQAFDGATQILIVSSNAAAYGGNPLAQHRSAIEAARDAGAKRIVYTSHMAASGTSAFPPMLDHAATEDMLRQSGLAWTSLRNGFYGMSGIGLMGDAMQTGVLEAPADGKVSWTAHADLGEAAAIILANEGRYDGPTPPLTGSQALDLADLANIASDLLGRPVRRQVITDDALRSKMTARGSPPRIADVVLGLYNASRKREFAAVDPTLQRLLGRPAIGMRDLIASKVGNQNTSGS
jgi:NAD(P)H dehydrogenase (quinone)